MNRRTRIKDVLLLLIRTLLLLLLVLLFAAPFVGDRSDFDPGKKTTSVFYLDTSSSMADAFNGNSKFDTAKNLLIKTINGTPRNTSIYIVTSDPDEKFKGNKTDALKFLNSVEIYGRERSLNDITRFSDSLFNNTDDINKILMILTDGYTPADEKDISENNYLKKAVLFNSDNARKEDISIDSVHTANRTYLYLKLSSGSAKTTTLDIFQDGRKIHSQDITFGEDLLRTVNIELNELGNSETSISAEIRDEGSNFLNNIYNYVIPELNKKKILIVGNENSQAVRSVITLINTSPDSVLIPQLVSPNSVNSVKFNDYSVIFFCGMTNLSSFTVSEIKNHISSGGSAYFSAGDDLNLNDYNSNLIPALNFPNISGYEKFSESYSGIKIQDMKHPVIRDVFSENFTGINSAEIFNYYKVKSPEWTSIITVGGDPLLMEKKLGKGKILFLTSGLERSNSNILENGISVPVLLNSFLYLAGNELESENSRTVGDKIDSEKYFYLVKPGKTLDQGADELSKRFLLKKPGFYKIYGDDGIYLNQTAVNVEREDFKNNADLIKEVFRTTMIDDADYKSADLISFESKDMRDHILILILILLCAEIALVRVIK